MTFSIAFVGVDGAGKSTLIEKIHIALWKAGWDWMYIHQNGFMKRFYKHQRSRWWEWLNHLELRFKNWRMRTHLSKAYCLLMDRCYICSLVYANIEGFPDIAYRIKPHAFKPDIVVLFEPVEELVPRAYAFTCEYKRILKEEGYIYFGRGFHLFGRITFWKQPEFDIPPLLDIVIGMIGAP